MSKSAQALWDEFVSTGTNDASAAVDTTYSTWAFGDSPDMADRLLALVITGVKRATCGSLDAYRSRGEAVPVPGEYSVVCDGAGEARCVIQTISVRIIAFEDVDEAFAAEEGEGDRSLASWRRGHMAYFERDLARLGLAASPHMPLVCERFRVLYVRGDGRPHATTRPL